MYSCSTNIRFRACDHTRNGDPGPIAAQSGIVPHGRVRLRRQCTALPKALVAICWEVQELSDASSNMIDPPCGLQ